MSASAIEVLIDGACVLVPVPVPVCLCPCFWRRCLMLLRSIARNITLSVAVLCSSCKPTQARTLVKDHQHRGGASRPFPALALAPDPVLAPVPTLAAAHGVVPLPVRVAPNAAASAAATLLRAAAADHAENAARASYRETLVLTFEL